MTKTLEGATGDIATDLAALRHDVAELSDTIRGVVQHQAKAVGSRASAAVGEVRDRIAGTAADARSRAWAMEGEIEAGIVRHPLATLLVAFGVGLALGMMSRGRA